LPEEPHPGCFDFQSWSNCYPMTLEPLRPLLDVRAPDPRHRLAGPTLETMHATLAEIRLHDRVPPQVAQLFETSKNLSLYAWFVFRFHPIAGFLARASLEMALREKWESVYGRPPSSKEKHFKAMLEHARQHLWIKAAAFQSLAPIAARRVDEKKLFELLKDPDLGEAFSTVPATPEEIDAELEEMDPGPRLSRRHRIFVIR